MRALRNRSQIIGPVLVLLVFGAAVWLLRQQLHHYRYRDIRASLAAIPAARVWLAVGLTILNYVILVGYDLLGVRSIGHPLPLGKISLAAFIGYPVSHNFGALLGGSSVRYRLYAAWGLSTIEIVQLLTALGLTFWTGMFALTGAVFLFDPLPIPAFLHLPFANVRPLGILLLLVVAGYLSLTASRRRPINFRGWEFPLPPVHLAVAQLAIAAVDLTVAAAVLYVLLPQSLDVRFAHFLGIYLLSFLAVITTHVPGGVGIFELAVLWLLAPDNPHEVLAALLVNRVVYYLLPLFFAGGLLAGHEVLLHRKFIVRFADSLGQVAPAITPRVFSFLAFLAGALMLFSAATPLARGRVDWVRDLLPLAVVEVSHFLGSLIGVGLLALAWGLQRRLDSAYWLALAALMAGTAFSVLKGLEYQEALFLFAVFLALLPARRHFYRKGALLYQPFTVGWTFASALVVFGSIWLGVFAHKQVEYSDELWWSFAFHGDASRSLRASVGVIGFSVTFFLARLLRPASLRPVPADASQLAAALPIIAASPHTNANLALLGDKMLLFNADKSAFIMYGVRGRTWAALGDPVGPPDAWPDLAWSFREFGDRFDARTVFYQVGHDHLSVYVDLGLSLLKLGEEARVPLHEFSLAGPEKRSLRHIQNRFNKEACSFAIVPASNVHSILPELRRVSDAWLADKQTREKGFSLGRFEENYIQRFPVATARRGEELLAFANVWLAADREELSVDLMRYAPDVPAGVMDWLFVELMRWGHEQGYGWFNLGMAPLSGMEQRTLAPIWHQAAGLVFRHGEHFYNFQGLRAYKEKFDPVWQPKYLASPRGLALPSILTDVAALISGGVTGLIRK